jgi:hypothetical protein
MFAAKIAQAAMDDGVDATGAEQARLTSSSYQSY